MPFKICPLSLASFSLLKPLCICSYKAVLSIIVDAHHELLSLLASFLLSMLFCACSHNAGFCVIVDDFQYINLITCIDATFHVSITAGFYTVIDAFMYTYSRLSLSRLRLARKSEHCFSI